MFDLVQTIEFDQPLDFTRWKARTSDHVKHYSQGDITLRYTTLPENIRCENSQLIITTIREAPDLYTSANISSQWFYDKQYGAIEFKFKVDSVPHFWPALWTRGEQWPQSGEIDTMEYLGSNTFYFTVHGPLTTKPERDWQEQKNKSVGNVSSWHICRHEWSPNNIKIFFDGDLMLNVNKGDIASVGWKYWPFENTKQYVKINGGVGEWAGYPTFNTANLYVDWVRIYDYIADSEPTPPEPPPTSIKDQMVDELDKVDAAIDRIRELLENYGA